MLDHYPANYTDSHGFETTIISNDSRVIRTSIRGVEFSGDEFDSLEPDSNTPADQLQLFSLHHNCLCSCSLEWQMPVCICDNGAESNGSLTISLAWGDPAPNGGLTREDLRIELAYQQQRYSSAGKSGWFEDELLSIQSKLPTNVFMKCCVNCLYSDYSPGGNGSFGCMLCFRNIKNEYLRVHGKEDFWAVSQRHERYVQETYLCPEFERRVPGTGYRG